MVSSSKQSNPRLSIRLGYTAGLFLRSGRLLLNPFLGCASFLDYFAANFCSVIRCAFNVLAHQISRYGLETLWINCPFQWERDLPPGHWGSLSCLGTPGLFLTQVPLTGSDPGTPTQQADTQPAPQLVPSPGRCLMPRSGAAPCSLAGAVGWAPAMRPCPGTFNFSRVISRHCTKWLCVSLQSWNCKHFWVGWWAGINLRSPKQQKKVILQLDKILTVAIIIMLHDIPPRARTQCICRRCLHLLYSSAWVRYCFSLILMTCHL